MTTNGSGWSPHLRKAPELRLISLLSSHRRRKGNGIVGNFPHERQRLNELIEKTAANGVMLMVMFTSLKISRTDEGPYPLYDFTSSGLTNSNKDWAAAVNNHRVSEIGLRATNLRAD